jgi:hypothetical protein
MRALIIILVMASAIKSSAQKFITRFESTKGEESSPYHEAIEFFQQLDNKFSSVSMKEVGPTDTYYPLHVVYFCNDGKFDIEQWHKKEKLIILINNAIHPGEPDGIDASMMLLRDAAMGKLKVPDNIVLAVIPVFNIGGALNRGSYSRANQNGPKEYGFRGNAQNLDLNRDFIKADAKETKSLTRFFVELQPDIFIDNHVSNGADYQHVMTLLSVNPSKQGLEMGKYLSEKFEPGIYASMKRKGYDLIPYVNHHGETPEKGWNQFYEPPRFASGFAALHRAFAFVPETHMLKPYKQRVESTYALMESFIDYAGKNRQEIQDSRKNELKAVLKNDKFVLDWKADTSKHTEIVFKGYEEMHKPSEVSGLPRLYYDRAKPFEKMIPFYNSFLPAITVIAPKSYVIPHAWQKVVKRLKMNGVKMKQLKKDTVMDLTVYRITGYESTQRPYEGHYLHTKVKYTSAKENIQLHKGDYIIDTDQPGRRYLVETLEPNAPDAFFAWGFFDAILQQKEYFSDYVFEDEAAEILRNDPQLKTKLGEKKRADSNFAKDAEAQLDFIYRHSPYYEPSHMRYPVYRID